MRQAPYVGHRTTGSLDTAILSGERPPVEATMLPAGCDALGPLLHRMWAQAPSARPTAAEVLDEVNAIAQRVLSLESPAGLPPTPPSRALSPGAPSPHAALPAGGGAPAVAPAALY